MDHYQAAAELVGLKEEDLIEKAIAESLEDAQALKMDADNLDAVLEANGLCRQRVPGEGDCQYLALMASAKAQGFNLGNLAAVRILAFQGLMMNKDRYENAWMDEWGTIWRGPRNSSWMAPGGMTSHSRLLGYLWRAPVICGVGTGFFTLSCSDIGLVNRVAYSLFSPNRRPLWTRPGMGSECTMRKQIPLWRTSS